jgi:NADP-dependent 3-hydroxy acid dehydrogenase YdfG
MNQHSMSLTVITAAVLGIGAMYPGVLARRIRNFLLFARNRGRLDDLAKEIASENVDEMLVVVPEARVTSFWNTIGPTVGQIPQIVASPFGDW